MYKIYFTLHLPCNSSGNTRPQSSQLAELLCTNPGIKSVISVRKLISTLKKKKKAQAGNELLNILPKSSHARKKPPSQKIYRTHVLSVHICLHASAKSTSTVESVQEKEKKQKPNNHSDERYADIESSVTT